MDDALSCCGGFGGRAYVVSEGPPHSNCFHCVVSIKWFLNHKMDSIKWFLNHKMDSVKWFLNHKMDSIKWFLNHKMDSIKWFLNQKMENYIFFKKWFLNQKMVSQNMVLISWFSSRGSQSSYGYDGVFSINIWKSYISQSKNGFTP